MLIRELTRPFKITSINRNDALVCGIDWPLNKGWIDQEYKGTPEQAKRLQRVLASLNTRVFETRKKKRDKKNKNKSHVTSRTKDGFYNSPAWRIARYKVLSASGGKCSLCGRTAKQSNSALHVDHIIPRSVDMGRQLDPTNLQVLCIDCNLGKSNRDCKDWRE
jgi:5-methylcytosine-specific restriction endonuclease McrA